MARTVDTDHIGGTILPQPEPQTPIIQGRSAEQGQHPRARARGGDAFFPDSVPQWRRFPGVNVSSADLYTMQPFPTRPEIRYMAEEASLGTDSVPRLPGRQPPAGWNGENDATSPFATGI